MAALPIAMLAFDVPVAPASALIPKAADCTLKDVVLKPTAVLLLIAYEYGPSATPNAREVAFLP